MADALWTTIDDALRELRPQRNWAWLARKLDATEQTVNNWKRRKVPANRYPDIARALGCSVEDLLAGDVFSGKRAGAPATQKTQSGSAPLDWRTAAVMLARQCPDGAQRELLLEFIREVDGIVADSTQNSPIRAKFVTP